MKFQFVLILILLYANVIALPASKLRITADSARIKTENALESAGEIGDYLKISEGGAYRVIVTAKGTPYRNVWPLMCLFVDNFMIDTLTVNSRDYSQYQFKVKLKSGILKLSVGFVNDDYDGSVENGADRNLYLKYIDIVPVKESKLPELAAPGEISSIWNVKMKRREEAALSAADSSIKKFRMGKAALTITDLDGNTVEGADIKINMKRHDFLFGCNSYGFETYGSKRENDLYKKYFTALFNYTTVPFYWQSYEPVQGKPRYAGTDKVINWCRQNKIKMKGHPLLWAYDVGIPGWMHGALPNDKQQQERIEEIISRYKNDIHYWEVVNEPSHLRGIKIEKPYHWAKAADPKSYLIVNDYQVMSDEYITFFNLLKQAEKKGVPFEAIGLQAHEPRTKRFPLDHVKYILDEYSKLGKDIHITEFTPTSSGDKITGSYVNGTWTEKAQADFAEKFYRICFGHPAVTAITWWDLCDKNSWLKNGGLLRDDFSPKPAYEALKNLIKNKWRTRLEGKSGSKGKFTFTGFYGEYEVTIIYNGKQTTKTFNLRKGEENNWRIVI